MREQTPEPAKLSINVQLVFTSKTLLTHKKILTTKTDNGKFHFVFSDLNLFQKLVVHKSVSRVYLRNNEQIGILNI